MPWLKQISRLKITKREISQWVPQVHEVLGYLKFEDGFMSCDVNVRIRESLHRLLCIDQLF